MRQLILLFSVMLFSLIGSAKGFKKVEGFAFVPSGIYSVDDKAVSIAAMYVATHEVTNGEYLSFLAYLKKENREEDFIASLPDTMAWIQPGMFNEPMAKMYFSHPSYANYPVVNISVEGANLYCEWLTEKMIELYGQENISRFRLPTFVEWAYAAKGGNNDARYSCGKYLRDYDGNIMCNFKLIGDEFITSVDSVVSVSPNYTARGFEDGAYYMASSMAYGTNPFGLYNMSGNVAELVYKSNNPSETQKEIVAAGGHWNSTGYDVRITSTNPFEQPNPFVGFRPVMTFVSPKL